VLSGFGDELRDRQRDPEGGLPVVVVGVEVKAPRRRSGRGVAAGE